MLMADETTRIQHVRTGRNLELMTIGWNSLEAIIAVIAGFVAGSIALVGFGLDSVIEVSSGLALLWRLSVDANVTRREEIESTTLKIVGITFFALAAYIGYDAIAALWTRHAPEASYVGIGLAALSLVAMPLLARAKRQVAVKINSRALQADSRQTDICAYLSAILLGGLLLNASLGWWWADPVAALVMVPIIAKEGRQAFKGDTCCDSCQ
jgi:divalent metal cation (Fe/Co/Zn/Cd) transporter